jgi:hypothetical protein
VFFTSHSSIVKLAEIGYQVQLPYPLFWQGLTNLLLLTYHEMEINHIIQLLYYLSKMNKSTLELEPALLSEKQQGRLSKIQKSASHQLMIAYIQD